MAKEKIKSYALPELKELWKKYTETSGLRMLVNGKWEYHFGKKQAGPINAAKAEVCRLRDVMSFPKYLEKFNDD